MILVAVLAGCGEKTEAAKEAATTAEKQHQAQVEALAPKVVKVGDPQGFVLFSYRDPAKKSTFQGVSVESGYGYFDPQSKQVVINPEFKFPRWNQGGRPSNLFVHGLALVGQNDKYGYIDGKGMWVIPAKFDDAKDFAANGLAAVKQDGQYGYIDTKGQMVIPPKFNDAYTFGVNGLAVASEGREGYITSKGYIDEKGTWVIPPQFDGASNFAANGLAAVYKNDRFGYIDTKGQMVIPLKYRSAGDFAANGLASVRSGGHYDYSEYIDATGNVVIGEDHKFYQAGNFAANGLALVKDKIYEVYRYIDAKGQIVFPQQFKEANGFAANGLAAVQQQDGKYGYIDAKGQIVISQEYFRVNQDANFKPNGVAKLEGLYVRYIDAKGKKILYEDKVCGVPVMKNEDDQIVWPKIPKSEICKPEDERRKAESERQAAENERKRAWNAELNSNDPQAMYLKAGTYMRNGDASKGTEIYEAIIRRFPSSEWAVKASDQLSAKQRDDAEKQRADAARERAESMRDSINSANREASWRAYEQCKIEMNSCYSRTNGKGNCYRDCDRLR